MKTMKIKLLLPILAVALAVGGAFASQPETDDALWVPGYVKMNTPCDTLVHCGSTGIPGCTAPNGQIAYGKQGASNCKTPLFRLN